MVIFLFLLLVAVILELIGAVAEGMPFLLILAILLVVGDTAFIAARRRRHSHRRHLRWHRAPCGLHTARRRGHSRWPERDLVRRSPRST
ncbi:hypothetical protein MTF65_00440 [Streptomyces sp. APSN-46.1]|uniref:hypothetical protein n=1 Tax=Streptomyces sp. APSN-46.1 TaxID=2929049 RepID=UPI001FB30300|nr:hypothetical protein [Streptomyces sp. APSN-46.1]MCJ1675851.1 hypothetical protein [Streptomyces sp. APSN-46.1]